jgi:hypothetical protein
VAPRPDLLPYIFAVEIIVISATAAFVVARQYEAVVFVQLSGAMLIIAMAGVLGG